MRVLLTTLMSVRPLKADQVLGSLSTYSPDWEFRPSGGLDKTEVCLYVLRTRIQVRI